MERMGEKLRRRREELGFTVDDIAETTRFRPELIRAIEEGRLTVFPAEAYLKAFLRAYAETLGLEPEEVIRDQRSEEERVQEALRGIRVRPHPRSLRKGLIVVASAAVAAVVAWFVLWPVLRDRDTSPDRAAQVLPTAIAIRDSMDVGTRPQDTTAVRSRGGQDEVSRAEVVPAGEPSRTAIEPAGEETEELSQGPAGEETEELSQGPAEEETEEADTSMSGADGVGIVNEAQPVSSEACLEVSVSGWATKARLRAGDIILVDGWLRPGYRDTFCSVGAFVLDYVTDKDAIALVLNGQPVDLPHSPGKFMADFEINPR
jgi:cytoskeletal protein RodZ